MSKNKSYQILINEISQHATKSSISSADDIDETFRKSDISSISERDTLYIRYIRNYTHNYNKRAKGQSKMKWIFFVVILLILLCLVLGTVIVVFIVVNKTKTTISDISIIGTSMAGVITSFIVLPKVIAKNLFPTTEDDRSADIFKSVIANDMKLRHFHNISQTKGINDKQNYTIENYSEVDDESL